MIRKIKDLFPYTFSEKVHDRFAKVVNDYYDTHPEHTSRVKFAEYIGIKPSRLAELTNKDSGSYAVALRFHHIIPFWEKGVLQVQSLKLDTSVPEEREILEILDIDPTLYTAVREARNLGATTEELKAAVDQISASKRKTS